MSWPLLLLACFGCYCGKALGALLPRRFLDHRIMQEAAPLLPIALLVGLIIVNSIGTGRRIVPDARLAGMAVAFGAVLAKLPFLAIVALAVITTAAVRAIS